MNTENFNDHRNLFFFTLALFNAIRKRRSSFLILTDLLEMTNIFYYTFVWKRLILIAAQKKVSEIYLICMTVSAI